MMQSTYGNLTIKEYYIKQVDNALLAEKHLLKTGKLFDFVRKFDGFSEFRILTEEELIYVKDFFGVK